MKHFRKIIAAALVILTMLSVSIPAGAASVRYQVITPNDCPSTKWLQQLCKDGSCNQTDLLKELCKDGNCTQADLLKQLCKDGNCNQTDLLKQLCKDGSCGKNYRLIYCSGNNCTNTQPPAETPAAEPTEPATEPAAVPTEPPVQPTQPAVQPTTPAQPADTSALSAYEQEVVTLTNRYRAKYGLAPLTADTHLSDIARMKSQDMHDKGYFDHTSPTYGTPFDMMKRFDVSYRSAGENIAMGYRTAQSVVAGWMNSPGHRANILNKNFTKIGVGYVADGSYCTQMFIG